MTYHVNKIWLKWLLLFFLMILPIVPRYIGLEVVPGGGAPFLSLIRAATLGLLGIWMFWVLFLAASGNLKFRIHLDSPIYQVVAWLGVYLFGVFVASLLSGDIRGSIQFLLSENVFLGILFFLCVFTVFRWSRDVDKIFKIWLFSALVILVLGFVDMALGFSVFTLLDLPGRLELIEGFSEAKERAGFMRMQATLDNPVALSLYLVMTFPLAAYYYINTSNIAARVVLAIFIWLIMAAVFFTYVRSAWFFLGLSFFLIFIYRFKFLITSIFLVISALVLLEAGGFSVLKKINHVTESIVLQGERQVKKSTAYRIEMINAGLETLKQSPILGVGPGRFGSVVEGEYYGQTILFEHHENFYITLLVETGILGFMVFLCSIFIAMRLIWRARAAESDVKIKSFYTVILLASGNYLGMSVFLDSFSYYQLGFLFWALLAAALIMVDQRDASITRKKRPLKATMLS